VKVKDLSQGMMIKPRSSWKYLPRKWNIPDTPDWIEYLSFTGCRINEHLTADTPMIYLGFKRDDWRFEGCRKHHRVLADNQIYILSGYDVRHLEEVP